MSSLFTQYTDLQFRPMNICNNLFLLWIWYDQKQFLDSVLIAIVARWRLKTKTVTLPLLAYFQKL